jgi:hypothetical protein
VAFKGNYAIKVLSARPKTISNPAVLHGSGDVDTVKSNASDDSKLDQKVGAYNE